MAQHKVTCSCFVGILAIGLVSILGSYKYFVDHFVLSALVVVGLINVDDEVLIIFVSGCHFRQFIEELNPIR